MAIARAVRISRRHAKSVLGWSSADEAATACAKCKGARFAGETGSTICEACPSGYYLPESRDNDQCESMEQNLERIHCTQCPSGWSTGGRKGQNECTSGSAVDILEGQQMLKLVDSDYSKIYIAVKFKVASSNGVTHQDLNVQVVVYRGGKSAENKDHLAMAAAEIMQSPDDPDIYTAVIGNGTGNILRYGTWYYIALAGSEFTERIEIDCPLNAECGNKNDENVNFFDRGTTREHIKSIKGYWKYTNLTFEPCPNKNACLSVGPTERPCDVAYKGTLCLECSDGFQRSHGDQCMACEKGPLNAIFIVLVTLFIALIMAYYVYDGIASMADIEEEGTMPFHTLSIRTLLSYLQVASMIRLYDIELPPFVNGLVSAETAISSTGNTVIDVDCSLSGYTPLSMYVLKLVLVLCAPIVLVLLIGIIQYARSEGKRISKDAAFDEFFAGSTVALSLLYPTIVRQSVLILSCRRIIGELYIDVAVDVECWGVKHMVVFISTALPGILLYIIGFPASLYIVLRRLQLKSALKHGDKNYDKRWALRLGFLYAGYEREGFVYWESLVLLRKASISAAVVLLSHFGTDVQINVSLAILVLCLYLQMRYEPLEHDWHDTMEARSLLASTLILLACHLASEASDEEGIIEGANATWLSFIVFLVTFAFMWTWARFVLIFLSKAEGQKREKTIRKVREYFADNMHLLLSSEERGREQRGVLHCSRTQLTSITHAAHERASGSRKWSASMAWHGPKIKGSIVSKAYGKSRTKWVERHDTVIISIVFKKLIVTMGGMLET